MELGCALCGSGRSLVPHHTSYDPEEIVILCRSCHRKLHLGSIDSNIPAPRRPPSWTGNRIAIHLYEEYVDIYEKLAEMCGRRGVGLSLLLWEAAEEYVERHYPPRGGWDGS